MNSEQFEKLGEIADSIDNVLAATELPMPAEFHLEQVKSAMQEWSDKIKSLYQEVSGENPWAG